MTPPEAQKPKNEILNKINRTQKHDRSSGNKVSHIGCKDASSIFISAECPISTSGYGSEEVGIFELLIVSDQMWILSQIFLIFYHIVSSVFNLLPAGHVFMSVG